MYRHLPFVVLGLLAASPAAAVDMPARKPGLWQMTMTREGGGHPPQVVQECMDATTDKQMSAVGSDMSKDQCSKRDIQNVGGKIIIDSVCKFGTMSTTSHAEISGNFESAYTVRVTSTVTGGPPAMEKVNPGGRSNMSIEAKWVGACKADQKPGDMIMPGGVKMNINDMQKMLPGVVPPR